MSQVGYLIAKIKYVFGGRNPEIINDYFRKQGVRIGNRTHIFSNISNGEPYLISIGDDVTISNNVSLITHDASVKHYIENKTDVVGKIVIGNNCFIGMSSVILPGVHIADNCIIGAGSVVTKSVKEKGTVWGGNPAKQISTVETLRKKYEAYAVNLTEIKTSQREYISGVKLIEK